LETFKWVNGQTWSTYYAFILCTLYKEQPKINLHIFVHFTFTHSLTHTHTHTHTHTKERLNFTQVMVCVLTPCSDVVEYLKLEAAWSYKRCCPTTSLYDIKTQQSMTNLYHYKNLKSHLILLCFENDHCPFTSPPINTPLVFVPILFLLCFVEHLLFLQW
jgi:hypothetical protein